MVVATIVICVITLAVAVLAYVIIRSNNPNTPRRRELRELRLDNETLRARIRRDQNTIAAIGQQLRLYADSADVLGDALHTAIRGLVDDYYQNVLNPDGDDKENTK